LGKCRSLWNSNPLNNTVTLSMRSLLFTSIFLFSCNYIFSQYTIIQPPLIFQGDTLDLGFSAGLNNPVFSSIDLNSDGIQDLFIYEKSGKHILTFLGIAAPGQIKYKYAPEYAAYFPPFPYTGINWMLLKDFTCDGKPDLFAGTTTGKIKVWKNISTIGSPPVFSLYTNDIKTRYPFFTSFAYTTTDLPAFTDVDKDGDLDILTFAGTSTTVEYHRNYALENYSRCDTFDFVLEDDCWGFFSENSLNNQVTLNISCKGRNGGNKTLHSGSTLLALDIDSNLTEDVMIGDISYNELVFLTNGGTPQTAMMISQDVTFPSYDVPAEVPVYPAAFFVDVNQDQKRDLLVSPFPENAGWNEGNIWWYENIQTDAKPIFAFRSDSFLIKEMLEMGMDVNPAVADVNADGLPDLILGNYLLKGKNHSDESRLYLLLNSGTITQPSFTLIDTQYLNISSQLGNTFSGAHPATGDLEGDGDIDLVIGNLEGKIQVFTNTAGPGNPVNWVLTGINYQNIDVGSFSAPQLVDISGDGKVDLLVGKENGTLSYFQNIGGPGNYLFSTTPDINPFGQVDVQPGCCTGYSVPWYFTNPQTLLPELWVSSEAGYIFQYDQIAGNLTGNFHLKDSIIPGVFPKGRIRLIQADIDGDTIPEYICGNVGGGLEIYKSSATLSQQTLAEIPVLQLFPNPFTDELNLFWGGKQSCKGNLFDFQGKKIGAINISSGYQSLNLDYIPAGIYLLEIQGSGCKLIKY